MTTPMDTQYVYAVLDIWHRADIPSDLHWRTQDGEVTFFATCSDVFWWATADCERIDPEDIPLLRVCLSDLEATDQEYLLPELFAARKRRLRPMRLWLYGGGKHRPVPNEKSLPLFEAVGPERDPGSEG